MGRVKNGQWRGRREEGDTLSDANKLSEVTPSQAPWQTTSKEPRDWLSRQARASHRLGFFSGSFAEGRRWQLTPAIGPDRWEGESSDQEATFWRGTRPTPPREDGAMKCSSWALASAGLGRSSQGGSNPKGEKLATSVTNRPQHDELRHRLVGAASLPRIGHHTPALGARLPFRQVG